MSKHSFIRDDLMAVVYILLGGLLSVVLFIGWGTAQAASTMHSTYTTDCLGRVVTGHYYADQVHVACDVQPGQRLDVVLPRGMTDHAMRYVANQIGGRLVVTGIVVDADF